MDFMADQLYSGRSIRILTIVDNYSRESLALRAGLRLTGDDGVTVLQGLIQARGIPMSIKVDNGPEFTSKVLDQWAYWNGVTLDFSRPGKPADNGRTEAFNWRLRAECLNEHWFLSVADAQEHLDAWRADYNGERPHGALKNRTPKEFAQQAGRGHPQAVPQARKAKPQRPIGNGRKQLHRRQTLTEGGTKTGARANGPGLTQSVVPPMGAGQAGCAGRAGTGRC
jgi:putative transposase